MDIEAALVVTLPASHKSLSPTGQATGPLHRLYEVGQKRNKKKFSRGCPFTPGCGRFKRGAGWRGGRAYQQ